MSADPLGAVEVGSMRAWSSSARGAGQSVEACAESAFELIRIHEGFLLKFKDGRSSRTAWARVTTGSSAAPSDTSRQVPYYAESVG